MLTHFICDQASIQELFYILLDGSLLYKLQAWVQSPSAQANKN